MLLHLPPPSKGIPWLGYLLEINPWRLYGPVPLGGDLSVQEHLRTLLKSIAWESDTWVSIQKLLLLQLHHGSVDVNE